MSNVKDTLKMARGLGEASKQQLLRRLQEEEEDRKIENIVKRCDESEEVKKAVKDQLRKDVDKPAKDPDMPKQPASNFFLWLNSGGNRKKVADDLIASGMEAKQAQKEAVKVAGERWNALSEAEQKPWTDQAEQERERYNAEMKKYREEHGTQKRRKPEGAPKGVENAYLRYATPRREALRQALLAQGVDKAQAQKDSWQQASREWHELTDAQKAPYIEAAEQDKARYKAEMITFKGGKTETEGHEEEEDSASASSVSVKSVPSKKREREVSESEVPKISVTKKGPITSAAPAPAPAPAPLPTPAPAPTNKLPAKPQSTTSTAPHSTTSTAPQSTASTASKPSGKAPLKKSKTEKSE